jgi:hypothetical protein
LWGEELFKLEFKSGCEDEGVDFARYEVTALED